MRKNPLPLMDAVSHWANAVKKKENNTQNSGINNNSKQLSWFSSRAVIGGVLMALLGVVQAFGAASFKPLPYADPFAPAASSGVLSYSQPASSVILNENLNGVSLPITRPMANLTNGLGGITIEWWLKQKPQGTPIVNNPDGTILHGPGFMVTADWQWGGGPGSIIVNLSQNKGGQFVGNRGCVFPLQPSDEQWHHYVVTYDLRTVRSYLDGELLEEKWIDNSTDRLGPFEDDSFTIRTGLIEVGGGVTTGGRRFNNGYLEGVRVSGAALSSWQVKRNYESARTYTKTIYVAPNGNGNGSQSSPMSLSAAMGQVGAATRIILQGGTYNGADFQVSRSGSSPREHCVIVGADGATPAIISGGSPALNGAGYISLRNLTFSSDNGAALQINNAPKPVTVDACRFSGNQRGLSVNNSAKVTVQNSVTHAGTGLYFYNSPNSVVRHNTMVNGSVGAQFDGSSSWITFLNNLMSGQGSASLVINNGSQQWYRGNGNLYNPSSGTAVAVNGQNYSPAQVNNKALSSAWYTFDTQDYADSRQRRTAHASEANSMAFAPTFVDAANGDFRLAQVQVNAIDAGASRTFQHMSYSSESIRRGCLPSVADATGTIRALGDAVDVGAYETVPLSYAVFNLDADYTCSAGVYKSDGTLVRTLFSGKRRAQGTNVVFWNGLDDQKQAVPNGTYTIKMIAHNVQYVWEGVVGNTSNPNANSTVHGSFEPYWGLTISGNTAVYTAGYNESKNELYKFDTGNPNKVTKAFGPKHNIYSDAAVDVASDANRVYAVNGTQVAVYNLSDGNAVTFGNGASKINAGSGRGWVEVQRNGNLLFVARKDQNQILIFDKNSGNQTGTMGVSQPKDMAVTASGELWVLSGNNAVKYSMHSGGGSAVQTISGFGNAVNIACSPADGMVIVADASTHQVKAYNSNGSSAWTLGQANGYAGNPTVTADKFYFVHVDQGRWTYMAPLAFQPDGSFWVCDTFLSRALHFSSSRQLLHEVVYQPHTYMASADINRPTRVFNRFTEYEVDYSKPLGQGWKISKFWGYNLPNYMYGFEDGVANVVTLSNGRTYGTVYDGSPGSGREIVELTATGIRETVHKALYLYTKIEKDGSIVSASKSGSTVNFYRKPLTGFSSSGDPQWGNPVSLGSAPVGDGYFTSDPYSWRHPQMAGDKVISYDSERGRTGYHLGAVKQGTSQWLWKALPSAGGMDGYGNFDSWCEYGGNHVMTSGRNIFAGFHGEFFLDVGQASQFYHFYDNGLFVGQFGSPLLSGVSMNAPGTSGNAFSPTVVDVGSDVYLYHNDEASRGSHRWKPVGASAIRELSSAISQGQAPIGTTNSPGTGITNQPPPDTGTNQPPPTGGTNQPPATNTVSGADLVVTSVSMSPASPAVGAATYFKAIIKNQGDTATTVNTLGCAFYLNGSKVTWWFQGETSLAPGESREVTAFDGFNGNLGAWTATAGTHTVEASVDDVNRFPEAVETNNRKSISFTVGSTTGTNTTAPKLRIKPNNKKMELSWPTTAGGVYQVTYKSALTNSAWTPLSAEMTATGSSLSYTDAPPTTSVMRLYNIKQVR